MALALVLSGAGAFGPAKYATAAENETVTEEFSEIGESGEESSYTEGSEASQLPVDTNSDVDAEESEKHEEIETDEPTEAAKEADSAETDESEIAAKPETEVEGEKKSEPADVLVEALEDDIYSLSPATEEVNLAAASPLNRLSFRNDDDHPWIVQSEGGRTFVQSGNAEIPSSSSELHLIVSLTKAGTVSFDYRAWGESDSSRVFDQCVFLIDGNLKETWGAKQNNWTTYTVSLTAGSHTLSWGYLKDNSANPPGDFFAVDNVKISPLAELSEALNVEDGELYFDNESYYKWTVARDEERTYAVSGNKGHDDTRSSVSTTVTLDDYYDLSFYYKVNSFSDMEFYLDDERVKRDHYVREWKRYRELISPGTHTLKWTYYRCSNAGDLEDQLCLDDVSLTPAVKPTAVEANDQTMALNTNMRLYSDLLPEETQFYEVRYESDNPAVVKVMDRDLLALKTGTAHITITSVDYPDVKKTITVTVENKGVPCATFLGDYGSGLEIFSSIYPEETLEDIKMEEDLAVLGYHDGKVYGYSGTDYGIVSLDDPNTITWRKNVWPSGMYGGLFSYDSVTQCFYGIFSVGGDDALYKIQPESGVHEKICDWSLGSALAVDSAGVGWSLYHDDLYQVNLSTGAYVKQAKLNTYHSINDIVIDPETDEMYAIVSGGSEGEYLYWIDRRNMKTVEMGYIGWMYSLMVLPSDNGGYDPSPFLDIKDPSKYWYLPVLWAYYAKPQITTGKNPPDNNLFMPDMKCSRAEVVTFLWRLAGCPEPTITENPFKDVKQYGTNGKEIYYYKPVLWALENEITTGKSADTFDPSGDCTRKQFVTFLWRAYGKQELELYNSPFTDVQDISKYWFKAVLWAYENGITTGTGDGTTFTPDGILKRKEVVTFMYRGFMKKGRP